MLIIQDAFDAIDMTDNSIRVLGGFPRSTRLKTLFISRNQISHIAANLVNQFPNLTTLVMAQNQISTLDELKNLIGIPLVHLVVTDNAVASLDNYRLFAIHLFPTLRVLDYTRVTQKVAIIPLSLSSYLVLLSFLLFYIGKRRCSHPIWSFSIINWIDFNNSLVWYTTTTDVLPVKPQRNVQWIVLPRRSSEIFKKSTLTDDLSTNLIIIFIYYFLDISYFEYALFDSW